MSQDRTPCDDSFLVEIEDRVCTRCSRLVPVRDFPHDSTVCNACQELLTAEDATARYEEMRQLLCSKAVRQMVAERKGTKIDAPHISEYVAVLVQKLGGLEALAQTHAKQIEYAIEEEPGSRKVLDHLKTLANLITASTEHRQSAPDVAGMTDAQLSQEIQVLSIQMLTEDRGHFRDFLKIVHEKAPELLEVDHAAG